MTPSELKNSILQLAIQGKLVEQRPDEGTGEELYRKIQSEKQALIKAGKIKKEKLLPEISDDEKPFDIPESWRWYRIGEIFNIINGFTPLKSNPDYWENGDIPWFTIDDVHRQGRFIYTTEKKISKNALSKNTERIVPPDSVLLCCTASVGEYAFTKIPLTTNQQFNALVVKPEFKNAIYPLYIYEFSKTLKSVLIEKAGKTTFNFLSVSKLSNLLIPLPPLAEQKRIVAKIEELLPLVDRYAEAWNRLEALNKRFPDDLKKSLLQLAIQGKLVEQRPDEGTGDELYRKIQSEKQALIKAGKIKKEKPLPEISGDEKPFDIPESWRWVRLGAIGITQTGNTPSKTHPEYIGTDIAFITPGDILRGKINYNNQALSNLGKSVARVCTKDSILQVCIGGSIGKAAITTQEVAFNQQINVITPLLCSSKYIFEAMQSAYFVLGIKEKAGGTATPIINRGLWDTMLIPLPPLAEQKRIVAKLEEILPLCERLK